jgi:uncharacterized protein (DUF849 family)
VAIAVAPNGGRRTKADHARLPITSAELARTASGCVEAGAAMMHLHVRDAQGRHVLDAGAYRRALHAIKNEVGDRLVLQITSEGIGTYTPEQQMAVVKAVKPEAASLALRELAPTTEAEPAFFEFLAWMKREHVAPQMIVYSVEEAVRLNALLQQGRLPWPTVPVLFVLGNYSGTEAVPADLLPFLAEGAPAFDEWMVCAFGRQESACVVAAALFGGSVRVGFENNVQRASGAPAVDNATQVRAAAQLLQVVGCGLLTGPQLRQRWEKL